MRTTQILCALCASFLLMGCEESLDDQIAEYMEFYYPSTTESYYDIVFDWGSYVITTHDKPGAGVHEDSQKYLGYITLRPDVAAPAEGLDPQVYLIAPDGAVWSIEQSVDIAKRSERQEVTVERLQGSTSTHTRIISSPSEPVIDHFLANQGAWSRYGTMVGDGDGYELERMEAES